MDFVAPQKCIVSVHEGDRIRVVNDAGEVDYRVPTYSIFVLLQYIEKSVYCDPRYVDLSEAELEEIILRQLDDARQRHNSKLIELSPCGSVLSASHICEKPPLPVHVGCILHVMGFGLVRVIQNPDYPRKTNSDYRYTVEKIK